MVASARRVSSAGAVISVGWYHSTPVRASSTFERQDLVGRRLEHVDPAKTVHLQVDEAGDRKPRAPARQAHGNDSALIDLDITADERPVDDGGGDTKLHGHSVRR